MRITDIKQQARDKNRVNIYVDGKYNFSLDVYQLGSLKIRSGQELTEGEIDKLKDESTFGKVYARALEYCLMRPHSAREVRDYLRRKTLSRVTKTGQRKEGISQDMADRVFERLSLKGYIDDEKFARFWVDNRKLRAGSSLRKLKSELAAKGVEPGVIEAALQDSGRSDKEEIKKIIAKKASRYEDQDKFMAYLARQGFSYDEIRSALG